MSVLPKPLVSLSLLLALAVGCSPATTTVTLDFSTGEAHQIRGLAACSPQQPEVRRIDPDRPLVLLVHGCYSSGGRFRSLADVFELHGQQTLCFNYDDRDSLRESSEQLRLALRGIHRHMRDGSLTIVAHSQGGLVSRLALSAGPGAAGEPTGSGRIEGLGGPGGLEPDSVRLVTVSSPFAGIRAASDCGSLLLHVASLGLTVAACQIATGSNWPEIHPNSPLVLDPPPLSPVVASHLAVVTDERATCRRRGADGKCEEDDFVFSIEEQDNARLLDDRRVERTTVAAGHAEIVGGSGARPRKLIEELQRHGLLPATPPEKREALARLLARLF